MVQTHTSDVRELIAAVDRRGTGYIGYDDFEAVMARSMIQQNLSVDAAVDLSSTIRLQPDTSALPFHEVMLLLIKQYCTSVQCKLYSGLHKWNLLLAGACEL